MQDPDKNRGLAKKKTVEVLCTIAHVVFMSTWDTILTELFMQSDCAHKQYGCIFTARNIQPAHILAQIACVYIKIFNNLNEIWLYAIQTNQGSRSRATNLSTKADCRAQIRGRQALPRLEQSLSPSAARNPHRPFRLTSYFYRIVSKLLRYLRAAGCSLAASIKLGCNLLCPFTQTCNKGVKHLPLL